MEVTTTVAIVMATIPVIFYVVLLQWVEITHWFKKRAYKKTLPARHNVIYLTVEKWGTSARLLDIHCGRVIDGSEIGRHKIPFSDFKDGVVTFTIAPDCMRIK